MGDLLLYSPEGTPLGELTGFAVKRATRSAFLSTSEALEDLLYEVVWRERPLSGVLRPADSLTPPLTTAGGANSFNTYLSEEGVEVAQRVALLGDLERLSRSYALAALDRLGWQRTAHELVEPEALRGYLQVLPEHSKLLERLLRLSSDAGILEKLPGGNYRVLVGSGEPPPDEALSDPEAFADRMAELYPHGLNELGLVRRSGVALADGLRGAVDPLDILFRSEGPGVTEYYFVAPASRASNRLLADAVANVVRDWTGERPLRVLEVGAGTGSATSVVLPELPANCDYMFTDISAGFFAEAESRFSGSGIPMEFRALDIEKEPTSQGYESHAYDLIIAANVLHATRDLGETLAHCRELLAPSGQLMALENMRGRGWQDITFGLLDGWWRFADDYRPDHAMTSPAVWQQALSDSGYEEVSFLGTEGADEGGPLGSSVLIARGPAEIAQPPGAWVICADAGGLGLELAQELASRNQTVVLAQPASPTNTGGTESTGETEGNIVRKAVVPDSRESWQSLLAQLPQALPGPFRWKACCISPRLTATVPGLPPPNFWRIRKTPAAAPWRLVQGLLDTDVSLGKGLWFITQGAQALERGYLRESAGQLSGSPLWGFAKVVAREAVHLQPRMLDLDPAGQISVASLADELMHSDREAQVAYRDGWPAGRPAGSKRRFQGTAATSRINRPGGSCPMLKERWKDCTPNPCPASPWNPGRSGWPSRPWD